MFHRGLLGEESPGGLGGTFSHAPGIATDGQVIDTITTRIDAKANSDPARSAETAWDPQKFPVVVAGGVGLFLKTGLPRQQNHHRPGGPGPSRNRRGVNPAHPQNREETRHWAREWMRTL